MSRLQEVTVPAKTSPAEEKTHDTINSDLGKTDDKPTRGLFEFMGGVLKK